MKNSTIVHVSEINPCSQVGKGTFGVLAVHEFIGKIHLTPGVNVLPKDEVVIPPSKCSSRLHVFYRVLYDSITGEVRITCWDTKEFVYVVEAGLTTRGYYRRYLREHLLTAVSPLLRSRSGDGVVSIHINKTPVVVNDEHPWSAFFRKRNYRAPLDYINLGLDLARLGHVDSL